ncbi:hypothetical protein ACVWZL_008341 [Bradyrhizobium sp. GM2.4]
MRCRSALPGSMPIARTRVVMLDSLARLPRVANGAAALPVPSRTAALIPVLPLIFPARL